MENVYTKASADEVEEVNMQCVSDLHIKRGISSF